ncbi:5-formyltetrahydrofolate cyclo-ligase [Cellulophaga sp. Hel_I_12]|uniref:5-formyltetrahydrofolate cyclo-ligase n=1 Tax=Cellulophaga sp. Hel_I_12 TaxID=1249972 RepID=UPI0006461558|nr:5-formyltetrahydrofolate cyclo-ligase [Cellulophaga sp. Hel_I_12]
MLKKNLRINFSSLRSALTPENISDLSIAIANKILDLPIWQFTNYHIFLSITEKKEIDTSYLMSILQGRDKNIILSKMVADQQLKHFLLTDNTLIKKNKWNVPEPVDGFEIDANKIDVVFIPLLAFDERGHRVGYGKGYYDAFLASCKPDVIKIGVSFFESISKIDDVFEADIPLDYCITPSKIYSF